MKNKIIGCIMYPYKYIVVIHYRCAHLMNPFISIEGIILLFINVISNSTLLYALCKACFKMSATD